MMKSSNLIDELVAIRNELNEPREKWERSEFLNVEDVLSDVASTEIALPSELMCTICLSERINLLDDLFFGYKIFDVTEFSDTYLAEDRKRSPFIYIEDADFKWRSAHDINFYKKDALDDSDCLFSTRKLWRICPIGKEKTDCLFVDLHHDGETGLYELELGHSAILQATTIAQHIDNVISQIRI